jgi:hypothetical protein
VPTFTPNAGPQPTQVPTATGFNFRRGSRDADARH